MGLPWCFGILEKHKWKGLILDDTELKFQPPPHGRLMWALINTLVLQLFQEITQFFWDYPDIIYFYFAMKDYDANYPVILRLSFFAMNAGILLINHDFMECHWWVLFRLLRWIPHTPSNTTASGQCQWNQAFVTGAVYVCWECEVYVCRCTWMQNIISIHRKSQKLRVLEELKSKWQICEGCATLGYYRQMYIYIYLSVSLQYQRSYSNEWPNYWKEIARQGMRSVPSNIFRCFSSHTCSLQCCSKGRPCVLLQVFVHSSQKLGPPRVGISWSWKYQKRTFGNMHEIINSAAKNHLLD